MHALPNYSEGLHQNLSSVRTAAPASSIYTQSTQSPDGHMRSPQQMSPTVMSHPHSLANMPPSSSPGGYNPPYPPPPPQQPYGGEAGRYTQYPHPVDEEAVWGAAIGFGHGEWTQFLDVLRPEQTAANSSRHMQGP